MQLSEMDAPMPALIQLSPMAMCVTNPRLHDNPVVSVNRAFTSLTGYGEADIIGRNCRFLSQTEHCSQIAEKIAQSVEERRGVLFEVVNFRKNGSRFWNAVMVAPQFDEAGRVSLFLGSQVEIPEPKLVTLSDRQSAAQQRLALLTRRQREILELMAGGRLNKQIAYQLALSEKTVKMHRAMLIQRLGVATSADAVRLAVEAGL